MARRDTLRMPMNRRSYVLVPALLSFLALSGCNSDAPAPPGEVEPAAEPAAAEPEPTAPKIASDQPVFEFGPIKPTDTVEHVFKIKNAGTADLKIERVQRT